MRWGGGGWESSPTDFIIYLIIFLNYNKITIEKLLKTFETVMEHLKRINSNSKQRNVIIEKYQNCEIVIRVKCPKM